MNKNAVQRSDKRGSGTVGVGDFAPDATLTDTNGRAVLMSSSWAFRPVVFVFLRHFGCIFCREQVALLRRDYQKFVAADGDVVCIAQGEYKTGKAFQIFMDLPFPILVTGGDTSVFQSYGLGRGTLIQLFGFRMLVRGVLAALNGRMQGRIVGDGFQMPGAFLVDKQGIIQYAHRSRDAADHAPISELIALLRQIQATPV